MTPRKCPVCSGPVRDTSGSRGRPPTYCSTRCRRSANLEIARVNDRLRNLEGRLSETRLADADHRVDGLDVIGLDDPALLEREIALQKQRLLDLLADDEPEEA
jgi:hypothetical protein